MNAVFRRWGRTALITGIMVALGMPLAGLAASQASVVVERQAGMKRMAAAVKTIAGMFGGQTDFESAALHTAAEALRDHSGTALLAQFPTDGLDLPGSNAEAAIATEPAKFQALAMRLRDVAEAFDDKMRDAVEITADMRMGKSMVNGRVPARRKTGTAGNEPGHASRRTPVPHDAGNLHELSQRVPGQSTHVTHCQELSTPSPRTAWVDTASARIRRPRERRPQR